MSYLCSFVLIKMNIEKKIKKYYSKIKLNNEPSFDLKFRLLSIHKSLFFLLYEFFLKFKINISFKFKRIPQAFIRRILWCKLTMRSIFYNGRVGSNPNPLSFLMLLRAHRIKEFISRDLGRHHSLRHAPTVSLSLCAL